MANTIRIAPERFPRDPFKKMMLDSIKYMYKGSNCRDNEVKNYQKIYHVMNSEF